jgi:hypothetical protein
MLHNVSDKKRFSFTFLYGIAFIGVAGKGIKSLLFKYLPPVMADSMAITRKGKLFAKCLELKQE